LLKLLLIRDDKPGHFRQSDGVAMAIARHQECSVERIEVGRPRWPLSHGLARWAAARLPVGPRLFRGLTGLDLATIHRPDLIVSAGSATLVPNVMLARHFSVPNIFLGTIRNLPATAFSAILINAPQQKLSDRHHVTLKPSPVDRDTLRKPAALDASEGIDETSAALAIGGPTEQYRFAEKDWEGLADLVEDLTDEFAIAWRVTTSRRTPAAAVSAFDQLLHTRTVRHLTVIGREGAQPMEYFLQPDLLFVTEDSATMVSEAVAACRPVITLLPASHRPSRDEPAFADLERRNLIRRLPIAKASASKVASLAGSITPLEDHPLDALRKLLQEALGPDVFQSKE